MLPRMARALPIATPDGRAVTLRAVDLDTHLLSSVLADAGRLDTEVAAEVLALPSGQALVVLNTRRHARPCPPPVPSLGSCPIDAMKPYPLQLEVSGPTALWTRPDTGSSPASYVAPTFSGRV